MSKFRKAVAAGLTAGGASAVTVLAKSGWHLDQATIAQAVGAFLVAGLGAGLATYNVRNAK